MPRHFDKRRRLLLVVRDSLSNDTLQGKLETTYTSQIPTLINIFRFVSSCLVSFRSKSMWVSISTLKTQETPLSNQAFRLICVFGWFPSLENYLDNKESGLLFLVTPFGNAMYRSLDIAIKVVDGDRPSALFVFFRSFFGVKSWNDFWAALLPCRQRKTVILFKFIC